LVLNQLAVTTDIGGDDRQRRSRGFQQHHRHPLPSRRHHVAVRRPHDLGNVISHSDESNAAFQAELPRQSFGFRLERASADQQQDGVGMLLADQSEAAQHRRVVLRGLEPTHRKPDELPAQSKLLPERLPPLGRHALEQLDIDPVGDDPQH